MALVTNGLNKQGTSWETGKTRNDTIQHAQLLGGITVNSEPPNTAEKNRVKPNNEFRQYQANAHPKRLAVSRIRSFAAPTGPGLSTQAANLPSGTQQADLRLSHRAYGLPSRLIHNFSSLGLNLLYPWQAECLQIAGSRNFIYSASTGAGKSLVADVLMLKKVLESGKKALLVLPYVALVQEKTNLLLKVVAGLERNTEEAIPGAFHWNHHKDRSIRVIPFFGGSKLRATLEDADIAVATIEKANGLVNQAIEEARIDNLGVLVLDELHMIDDPHRGYLLEPLVSKVRSLEQDVQIVGMSATLSNISDLAKWLDARWYESHYRAVPVAEYLVHENRIYSVGNAPNELTSDKGCTSHDGLTSHNDRWPSYGSSKAIRAIEPSREPELFKAKHNAVVSLAMETVDAGYGVLVFCSSRFGCQTTADLIARASPFPTPEIASVRQEVIDSLRSLMGLELDPVLERTIPMGVGFHHAGLMSEEKDIIADAFDRGILKALVATSSLAAGVNLPARRVILQEARQGIELVAPTMLRQMRGRAGRKGKDEIGESYVCCTNDDVDEVQQLLESELPPATSCLSDRQRGVKRALLEIIAIGLTHHEEGVQDYACKTLLSQSVDKHVLDQMCSHAIQELTKDKLLHTKDGCYEATPLGKAIISAGLEIDAGVFIHTEIQRALQHFVMDCDLHVIYLFTPVHLDSDISWSCFLQELEDLSIAELRVLEYTRINPKIIANMAASGKSSKLPEDTLEQITTARIYRRFYIALQLKALCEEIPIGSVAKRFGVSRGVVQSLSQSCHSFAASMIGFCQRLGYGMLASILEHMADRLRAGARADLLELAKIPFVKSKTARTLWENGYKGLRSVAEANPDSLTQVLLLAQPRKRRALEEEEGYINKIRLRAEIVISQAQRLWEKETIFDVEDGI